MSPGPLEDPARVAAVRGTGLLDTEPEEVFDELARLARRLLDTPFALVTLVDDRRCFWKSRIGIPENGPRQNAAEDSFCQYVIASDKPLVLGDVRRDPRTRDTPAIALLGVVAWAGYPLRDRDGRVLGTICAVDTKPREWTASDEGVLEALALAASTELQLRSDLTATASQREALRRMFMQTPGSVVVLRGPDLVVELINAAGVEWLDGRQVRLRQPLADTFPELETHRIVALLKGVFDRGATFHSGEQKIRVARGASMFVEDAWVEYTVQPVRGPDGQVEALLILGFDVTERVRIRERASAEAGTARLLADVSLAMDTSVGLKDRLQELAKQVVPRLGDLATVRLAQGTGPPHLVAVSHVDPDLERVAWQLYRSHTPSELGPGPGRVIATGISELVPDITEDQRNGWAPDEVALGDLRRLDVTSHMAVPLTARGKVLGALTLQISVSGRRFSEADLEVAREVGRRAGLALDNALLHEAEVATRDRLERLQRLSTQIGQANSERDLAELIVGAGADALAATAGAVVLCDEAGAEVVATIGYPPDVLRPGQRIDLTEPIPIADLLNTGQAFWFEAADDWARRFSPPRSELGAAAVGIPLVSRGVVQGGLAFRFGTDERFFGPDERELTLAVADLCSQALDRVRLRAQAERRTEREREIAERKLLLAQRLHEATEAILRERDVARRLHIIAVWAAQIVGAHQAVIRLGGHDAPWEESTAAVWLSDRYGELGDGDIRPDCTELSEWVRTTNRPIKVTQDEFAADPRWNGVGPEGVWYPRQRGWLAAPLVGSDGLNMGLIQLSHKRDCDFDDEDLADLVELATIASVAVENVQLEERERQLSRTLQSSLLPRSLPLIHGIDLAARYVPSGEGVTAGGDWYDAFVLPDDRLVLVIGDVVGNGPDAAVTMGQVRSALAAYLLDDKGPAEALTAVSRFCPRVPEAFGATAACVIIDGHAGRIRYARAGHPPPVIAVPSAPARLLDDLGGPPLGVNLDVRYKEGSADFPSGTTLLLYTDGLIERRGRDLGESLDNLTQRVGEHDEVGAVSLADGLLRALVGDAGTTDDVAVLVAMSGHSLLRLDEPAEARMLSSMRRRLREALDAAGVSDQIIERVIVAVSEACANGVEHAYAGRPAGKLQMVLMLAANTLSIVIRDFGAWRPARPTTIRGWGIKMMRHEMDHVDLRRHHDGTEVVLRLDVDMRARSAKIAHAPSLPASL